MVQIRQRALNLATAGLIAIVSNAPVGCIFPPNIADLPIYESPQAAKIRNVLAGEWERNDGAFITFYQDNGFVGEVTLGDLNCMGMRNKEYVFCNISGIEINDNRYDKGMLTNVARTEITGNGFRAYLTRDLRNQGRVVEKNATIEGRIIGNSTIEITSMFSDSDFFGAFFGNGTSVFTKVER